MNRAGVEANIRLWACQMHATEAITSVPGETLISVLDKGWKQMHDTAD